MSQKFDLNELKDYEEIILITENISFENNKHILRDSKIKKLALDYSSHQKLSAENIPHTLYDNALDESDKEIINNTAYQIATTWYAHDSFKNEITFDGINFGWLLEQEFYPYLLILLSYIYQIKKLHKTVAPKKLYVVGSLFEITEKLFKNSKIEKINEEREFDANTFEKFAVKYNLGKSIFSLRLQRAKFFKLRKIYENTFLPIFNTLTNKKLTKNSQIMFVDFEPTTYFGVLNFLSKKNKSFLLLNRRRPAIWNASSLKSILKTNAVPITYNQFLNSEDKNSILQMQQNLKGNIKSLFQNNDVFNSIFSIQDTSFWKIIQKDFERFCISRFNEAIYEQVGANALLEKIQPKVIIHFFDVALQEKILISKAISKKIKCVMMQHGSPYLSFPNFHGLNRIHGTITLFEEQKMAVWGNMVKNYAVEHGIMEEKIIECGSPRFDRYFQTAKKLNTNNKDMIIVGLNGIDTRNIQNQMSEVYARYEEGLRIVCESLKKIKNKRKIVKLHPGDMGFRTVQVEPIIKSIDPSIEILVTADLVDLLGSSDVIISVGLTTLFLEANILKKPAISIIADEQDFLSQNKNGYAKLFRPSERDDFDLYLNKILNGDKAIIDDHLKKGNEFVEKYLINCGNASESLASSLIEECEK